MKCESCHKDVPSDAVLCPYCGVRFNDKTDFGAFEYAAFISYRHLPRDQEIAKRVQQAIETYKLPRSVSSKVAGRRLGKCFRDEDELAASSSLPDRILEALSQSSALVVVCTPNTKDSAWVEREVAAFAEMRGRDRIFAVLADGSSAESIPDYLKVDVSPIGNVGKAHSNPLAADMRPEASAKQREEILRLIAAIANCGFDDLKQRNQVRKRKRLAIAVAVALLAGAATAAAIAYTSSAHQDALASESRRLAVESEQLLAKGDRYGALNKALEALPRSEASNDRPFVPEARSALEDALVAEFDPNRLWIPCYSLYAGADDTKLAINPDKGWLALLKPDMTVDFFETLTGKPLASADLRASMENGGTKLDTNLDNWTLLVAGDYLVAAERTGDYSSFCIEAKRGEVTWAQDLAIDAIAVSSDNRTATLFVNTPDAARAGAYRIPFGEWLGSVEFKDENAPQYAGNLPSAANENGNTIYVGFDHSVGKYDLAKEESVINDSLGGSMVLSVALADTAVIATSIQIEEASYGPNEPASANCVITALDRATLQPLWANEQRWFPKPYFKDTGYVNLGINPHAVDMGQFGEPAVIYVAGNVVQVYAASDGALIFEQEFPEAVVGAQAYSKLDGNDYLNIACADGTVYFTIPSRTEHEKVPISFSYPGPIDESTTFWDKGANILSVGHSLDDPKRYYVFRTENRTAETAKPASDYSLDELISLAHEQLDVIAQ